MIEAYAFLAAFALQILVGSLVGPSRTIRYIRAWATTLDAARFKQLHPDVDCDGWAEHFTTRYRAANFIIAVLGLLLSAWLFSLAQRPDWVSAGAANVLPALFCMLQLSPILLLLGYGIVRYRYRNPPPDAKRKALLQRRGLFDFASPLLVFVAIASYVLFIPFAILVDLYVYQNASISQYCYHAIQSVTVVYALNTFLIYKQLYGRKNPIESHEGRARSIGIRIKTLLYGSIAVVWFISISAFVTKLHLENWKPFAVTVYCVVMLSLATREITSPPRKPETEGLSSGTAT